MSDALEDNKWRISNFENFLDAWQKGLESYKERHDGQAREYISNLKNQRTIILTAIGIVLTVILALASIDASPIPDSTRPLLLYIILLAILPIAGGIYIFLTVLARRASNLFSEMERSYADCFIIQSYMRGFWSIRTQNIHSVDSDQLDILSDYCRIVEAGIICYLRMKVRKLIQKGIFRPTPKQRIADLNSHSIEKGMEIYLKRGGEEFLKSKMLSNIFKVHKDDDYSQLFDAFNYFVKLVPDGSREDTSADAFRTQNRG
jgi:hypothetical protein